MLYYFIWIYTTNIIYSGTAFIAGISNGSMACSFILQG